MSDPRLADLRPSADEGATRLLIVQCGSKKRPAEAGGFSGLTYPARELYTGSLFQAARRAAERVGAPWLIASARFGLVHPDWALAPYDSALGRSRHHHRAREEWAYRCAEQLLCKPWPQAYGWDGQSAPGYRPEACAAPLPRPHSGLTVSLLMSGTYAEPLARQLRRLVRQVSMPLSGLGIGQRLQRLQRMSSCDHCDGCWAAACDYCEGSGIGYGVPR